MAIIVAKTSGTIILWQIYNTVIRAIKPNIMIVALK
jgi:hypothetical protein